MINAVGMAAMCSSSAVWLLLSPPPAAQRLDRLLTPRTPPKARALAILKSHADATRERRQRPRRRRTSVIELCDGMAAELAAGRTPGEAFTSATTVLDPHISIELLSRPDDQPIPDRLDELAAQPGAEGLRLLAACWRVGSERGGTFATVLDGLAAALRDEEAQRQDVAVQLAGPRATARLLAALPLLGVGMAAALGAHPVSFLCGSLPGLTCLITGTALNATGLYWTRRLAKSAESPT